MDITTVGVDLAKDVITVCTQARSGQSVEKRDIRRTAFRAWLQRLPAGCVVGMEACSSSHYWAREAACLGLEPRIMAAEFVQPFRKSRAGKNDRNDAEAIAVAVREANMRFVAVKSVDQQARLARHRVREGWKEERTALVNRIRGLLAEFGVSFPRSTAELRKGLVESLHDDRVPPPVRELIASVREHLDLLDQRIATAGNAREFRNGRQFAAWMGLTPRQFSSGGKTRLGSITRRGDAYLRTLLAKEESYNPEAWRAHAATAA